jgi:spore germination protein YaaH
MSDCARFSKQICYSEIASLLATPGTSPTGVMFDARSSSAWADYTDPATKKRRQVWFDTPGTLAMKMAALRDAGVRGVGFWQSGCLDYSGGPAATGQTREMWDAISVFKM